MTLLETLLAISMMVVVGAGISGMMHVLSNDIAMQHDVRTGIVRAALVQARLSAYVGRSRCMLDLEPSRTVFWLQDTDADDAVHATEVRWLEFDAERGQATIGWIKATNADTLPIYDTPESVDWWRELDLLERRADVQRGTLNLAGDLAGFTFRETMNASGPARRRDALERQRIEVDLELMLSRGTRMHRVGESIRLHRVPGGEVSP
jgi:hypothetical protein